MNSIMANERPIRLFSLFCSVLALPLLIATTVVSLKINDYQYWRRRPITTFCFAFIPLTFTTITLLASFVHHKKNRSSIAPSPARPRIALLDLIAGTAYLAVLIPIWSVEIGKLNKPGYSLLAGYTTAPMIVNM